MNRAARDSTIASWNPASANRACASFACAVTGGTILALFFESKTASVRAELTSLNGRDVERGQQELL